MFEGHLSFWWKNKLRLLAPKMGNIRLMIFRVGSRWVSNVPSFFENKKMIGFALFLAKSKFPELFVWQSTINFQSNPLSLIERTFLPAITILASIVVKSFRCLNSALIISCPGAREERIPGRILSVPAFLAMFEKVAEPQSKPAWTLFGNQKNPSAVLRSAWNLTILSINLGVHFLITPIGLLN